MHCRTRSPAEIYAFMHDELASSGKRAARSATAVVVAPEYFDHSHSTPTLGCEQQPCEHVVNETLYDAGTLLEATLPPAAWHEHSHV